MFVLESKTLLLINATSDDLSTPNFSFSSLMHISKCQQFYQEMITVMESDFLNMYS